MSFKLDKKKNALLFQESDWLALLVGLFTAYNRVFGGEIQHYKESKQFFLDELENRAWFKPLNKNQKEMVVLKVLKEYAKGFSDETN